jgi:hypothetical protein
MSGNEMSPELTNPESQVARALKKTHPGSDEIVASYVAALRNAVGNQVAFDGIVTELRASKELTAAKVIAISEKFALPSSRITSRSAAIAAISKRFVELMRFRNKNSIASKTRPW